MRTVSLLHLALRSGDHALDWEIGRRGSADSGCVQLVAIELMVGSVEETQLMGCAIARNFDRIATAETCIAVPFPITVIQKRVQAIPAQISKGISGNIFPNL